MPQYRELFSKGQRQQAMADALAGQALTPQQRPQGRVVANTGFADALGSLGQALASRRLGKKAEATTAQAEEARRQAQAAALRGMSQPPNLVERSETQSPYSRAQVALEADVNPGVVESYMQQQMPQQTGAGSASVQGYNLAKSQGYEGTYLDYKREFEGREANAPSSVMEWQTFNSLSPEDQTRYLEMKRNVPIETVNQVPTRVLPGGQQQPLSSVESEAQAAADIRGAETRAAEETKVGVEATADLPRVEQNATQAMNVIDQLLEHPGFSGIFGKSGILQPQLLPGSKWADANALLNQVKGKTFLEAFQTLKGGGQITELEGIKAEQAIARLERAQSDDAARLALLELKEIAQIGVERARRRAGMGAPAQAQPQPQSPQQQQQGGAVNWSDL